MRKSTWLGLMLGLSLSFPVIVRAQALTSMGVHVGSWHSDNSSGRWNNSNPGIFGTMEIGGVEYIAGSYYNSERRQTFYAGYNWRPYTWLSVPIVLASGYEKVMLMPVPTVHVPLGRGLSANVSVLPKVRSDGAWVVHSSFQLRF